jgi:hypothetical protein
LWSYQVGGGVPLLRRFCQAMDNTQHGILACGVCRLFNIGRDGKEHEDESKPGGIDSVERLERFYSHFGFVRCDEKSEQGRPVIARTSPNYTPNPHEYIEQESVSGGVEETPATTQSSTPRHLPAYSSVDIALNRPASKEWWQW